MPAAKVALPSKRTLNRPLNLLFPIECSNINDTEDKTENMKDDMDTVQKGDNVVVQPKKQSAKRAELKIKNRTKVLS